MLIPAVVIDALLDAGVHVRPKGPRDAELEAPDGSTDTFSIVVQRQPLSPSHLAKLRKGFTHAATPVLLLAPTATAAAADAARSLGWSVITYAGPSAGGPGGHLLIGDAELRIGQPAHRPSPGSARRGPRAWGALSLERHLLDGGLWTQAALSQCAGVSQPLVSAALNKLLDEGLVQRSSVHRTTLWTATDFEALLGHWLDSYPGPGGITTYWYGLDDVVSQVKTLVAALDDSSTRLAVSGDVAADLLAPWRRPRRGVVYCSAPDLARVHAAGLTPSGSEDATLHLVVPEDAGVWAGVSDRALAQPTSAPHPLAHATQVLWDVRESGGPDVDQAEEALTSFLQRRAHDRADVEHWSA